VCRPYFSPSVPVIPFQDRQTLGERHLDLGVYVHMREGDSGRGTGTGEAMWKRVWMVLVLSGVGGRGLFPHHGCPDSHTSLAGIKVDAIRRRRRLLSWSVGVPTPSWGDPCRRVGGTSMGGEGGYEENNDNQQ
jgi:hypothetical protein